MRRVARIFCHANLWIGCLIHCGIAAPVIIHHSPICNWIAQLSSPVQYLEILYAAFADLQKGQHIACATFSENLPHTTLVYWSANSDWLRMCDVVVSLSYSAKQSCYKQQWPHFMSYHVMSCNANVINADVNANDEKQLLNFWCKLQNFIWSGLCAFAIVAR